MICEVIAPNAGKELFEAMNSTSDAVWVSEELTALMTAYKNAITRNLKLQILSIYHIIILQKHLWNNKSLMQKLLRDRSEKPDSCSAKSSLK